MSASPAVVVPPSVIVMGVSGCGKTTVGKAIADGLDVRFADADEFHPKANIDKMASGQPLTDDDRWPWLEAVGRWMGDQEAGSVVACSALRVAYRDLIRQHCPTAYFVHLAGPIEVVTERVAARTDHYMPAALMQSQYDTLEDLQPQEAGVVVSFDQPIDRIVDEALAAIAAARGAVS